MRRYTRYTRYTRTVTPAPRPDANLCTRCGATFAQCNGPAQCDANLRAKGGK